MFHDRGVENKINRVHERALRCVYRDDISTFEELLRKDNSFTIHHRNISSEFKRPSVNTVHYGQDSLRYFGSVIWDLIPQNIREINDLDKFKDAIRNWKPNTCPCRLCKIYISRLGYTNVT